MNFEKDIEHCLHTLQTGGIILYPTDTIWGIGCDATQQAAVEKIYSLKRRPDKKTMIVLVADQKDILQYVANPDPAVFDYLKRTDKPTTVIYEGAIGLADNLIADDGTVAIRIVRDTFCKHLIKRFRKPLVSTSANISGSPAAKRFADINAEIKDKVDYIVTYRQDDETTSEPSSLIRWNKGTVKIIRP